MRRMFGAVTALGFALTFTAGVMACDKEQSVATVASANSTAGGTEVASLVDTGVARVMKQMPQMVYKVGDVETPCGYTAKSTSSSTGKPVMYLVGGSAFDCEKTAMNKLATLMKAELANAASVRPSVDGECYGCPMTAAAIAAKQKSQVKYMVAGVEFESQDQARTVADQLASKMKEYGATASASGCSKSGCSKSTKTATTASSTTASSTKGCCKSGCAKAASGGEPCAKTAAATGGCSKSKEAQTASAGKGGCCKDKAKTAAASGCSKDKAGCTKGETAKAEPAKTATTVATTETPTTTLTLDCCKKKAGDKTTTTAKADVEVKETTAVEGSGAEASGTDETPELARAKQMVREIVEFVAAAKTSQT